MKNGQLILSLRVLSAGRGNLIFALSLCFILAHSLQASQPDLRLFYGLDYQADLMLGKQAINNSIPSVFQWVNSTGFGFLDARIAHLTGLDLSAAVKLNDFYGFSGQAGKVNSFRLWEAWVTRAFSRSVILSLGRFLNYGGSSSAYLNGVDFRYQFSAATNRIIGFGVKAGADDFFKSGVLNASFSFDAPRSFCLSGVFCLEGSNRLSYSGSLMIRKILSAGFASAYFNAVSVARPDPYTAVSNTAASNSYAGGPPSYSARLEFFVDSLYTVFHCTWFPVLPAGSVSPYRTARFDAGFNTRVPAKRKTFFLSLSLPVEKDPEYFASWGASFRGPVSFSVAGVHRSSRIMTCHSLELGLDMKLFRFLEITPVVAPGYEKLNSSSWYFLRNRLVLAADISDMFRLETSAEVTLKQDSDPALSFSISFSGQH